MPNHHLIEEALGLQSIFQIEHKQTDLAIQRYQNDRKALYHFMGEQENAYQAAKDIKLAELNALRQTLTNIRHEWTKAIAQARKALLN